MRVPGLPNDSRILSTSGIATECVFSGKVYLGIENDDS